MKWAAAAGGGGPSTSSSTATRSTAPKATTEYIASINGRLMLFFPAL